MAKMRAGKHVAPWVGGWVVLVCTCCCASLKIFENMHKDQLEEIVTLEGCSPLGFQGKSESLPGSVDKELAPYATGLIVAHRMSP